MSTSSLHCDGDLDGSSEDDEGTMDAGDPELTEGTGGGAGSTTGSGGSVTGGGTMVTTGGSEASGETSAGVTSGLEEGTQSEAGTEDAGGLGDSGAELDCADVLAPMVGSFDLRISGVQAPATEWFVQDETYEMVVEADGTVSFLETLMGDFVFEPELIQNCDETNGVRVVLYGEFGLRSLNLSWSDPLDAYVMVAGAILTGGGSGVFAGNTLGL